METPVAVVGGGSAGAAACLALCAAGYQPLWLAPAPPDQRVGESLAAAAVPILESLGVLDLLHSGPHREAYSSFSAWGGERLRERSDEFNLQGRSWLLDRPRFEADLQQAARTAGAVCIQTTLRAFEAGAGCWRLRLANGEQISARALIDCTGRKALIGRRYAHYRRLDRLTAAYAFLAQRDPMVEPTPASLVEAVADGWWYAALLPQRTDAPHRLVLAWFTDADLRPRGLSREPATWAARLAGTQYVSRWLDSAGFRPEGPPHIASAGSTWLDEVHGLTQGALWCAAGDAAAAFDPLSSHGLTSALWGGRQAGRAVADWLGGDSRGLRRYGEALRMGVEGFQGERRRAYGAEARFADQAFWQRRRGT